MMSTVVFRRLALPWEADVDVIVFGVLQSQLLAAGGVSGCGYWQLREVVDRFRESFIRYQ